jgi:predicted permease
MTRFMMVLLSMIGTALAASGLVLAFDSGNDPVRSMIVLSVVGALLALPVTWWIDHYLS